MSWEEAAVAATAAGVEVRILSTLEEIDQGVRVQIETWGERQLIGREILRAFADSGNLLQGAFREGRMIGFALGFLGRHEEDLHLHSHLLAVSPEVRNRGTGFALKLAQRAWAKDAGCAAVRWTFDPLLARNAYFNLAKLGAVADRFERAFYGQMEDLLNAGDRSDRLFVRWDTEGDRSPVAPAADAVAILDRDGAGHPRAGAAPHAGRQALVRIPADYAALRERDPASARAWRDAGAAALEAALGAGLTGVGFGPDAAYVFA